MTVNTKYNIGDKVYIFDNFRTNPTVTIRAGIIKDININKIMDNNPDIEYTIKVSNQTGTWNINRNELNIYSSRDDLNNYINTLLDDADAGIEND